MRFIIAVVTTVIAALSWNAATAFPDGAPWGSANPAAEQNCASCHFDADPVFDSPFLKIDGLPETPEAGKTYDLHISFSDPDIIVAGYQLFAQMADAEAGVLRSIDDNAEFIGSAIRSTAPIAATGGASWSIEWRVPAQIDLPILFYIAATAANDDGSPFGDTIHFRSYELAEQ